MVFPRVALQRDERVWAKGQKQPKCPLADETIHKMQFSCAMTYSSHDQIYDLQKPSSFCGLSSHFLHGIL